MHALTSFTNDVGTRFRWAGGGFQVLPRTIQRARF